ncbi:VWA domain-containing protein [Pontibacterium sp.]|uniref:VWA domain-containing protein n=1 Tax=Pontibacterium sp. TaxID=2036026 RepID=UPI003516B5D8
MLNEFHFLQPWWLLLFPLLMGITWLWLRANHSTQHWAQVCDAELLPFLVREGKGRSRAIWPLAVLVSLLLALAAAQPVWQKQPQPAVKQGGAVVIVWDLSASMNATDLKPSRLQRARFKIEDLLDRLGDSQAALLVYAADAFVVTPLTEDGDTIRAQLPAMQPEIMPAQGSRADRALQQAGALLQQAQVPEGDILLVSDEVEPALIAADASRLKQQGYRVSILSVGTREGAPIPTGSGLLKDRQGEVVVARTDLGKMREAAALGGGVAVRLSNDDTDLDQLSALFAQSERRAVVSDQAFDYWVAEGPWILLLTLPLLLPLFRRGMLNLLLPVMFLSAFTASPNADAGWWQDLWRSPDQKAAKAYATGDKAAAAKQFEDPRWKQVAQYESGDYQAALEEGFTPETAADWYNRGNVLARNGKLDEAIAAYHRALELQPDFDDAKHNKTLLEELKQQASEQENQSQQSGQQNQQASQQSQPQSQQGGEQKQSGQQNSHSEQDDPTQSDQARDSAAQQNQGGDQGNDSAQQSAPASDAAESRNPQESSQHAAEREAQTAEEAEDYLRGQIDQRQQGNDSENEGEAMAAMTAEQDKPVDEAEQARQQLLNKIVDDPAGLWRRKFIYQYRQRAQQDGVEEKTW